MLNELLRMVRRYDMLRPGDRVFCAVSGGADSMALLWGMYLLQEKLGIQLEAAHFNHRLRGAESDRDESFVRAFCQRFEIPLTVGSAQVNPGKKGLEAAAREARYGFFATLPGKIATAHTADDNAETVLMHLVRGTGLKGLGGIAPVRGSLLRPMLAITREQVEAFLTEYSISHVEDSSNTEDIFLRNRLRKAVMPLLKGENPKLSENLSEMAQRLRQDEKALAELASYEALPPVSQLQALQPAVRSRMLEAFLKDAGVPEPEGTHIALLEALVFSTRPSASADLPGGIRVQRSYDTLAVVSEKKSPAPVTLSGSGQAELPDWGLRATWGPARETVNRSNVFTVAATGPVTLDRRRPGDKMRLPGGTKELKKLFIDRKIPAQIRDRIPVLRDETGVLAVLGIGVNQDRMATALPAFQIQLEEITQ